MLEAFSLKSAYGMSSSISSQANTMSADGIRTGRKRELNIQNYRQITGSSYRKSLRACHWVTKLGWRPGRVYIFLLDLAVWFRIERNNLEYSLGLVKALVFIQ